MRLNRFLAAAGVASRRRCDDLIRAGAVTVDGRRVLEPWYDVAVDSDRVAVEGKLVGLPPEPTYLLLHKPAGFITTLRDPQGRPTAMSLFDGEHRQHRLFPVGRLDAETTGALLITDDGELAFRLTHPSFESWKEYIVRLAGPISEERLQRLRNGLELEDGPVHPDEVSLVDEMTVVVVLHEGRKRIVRRMFSALGCRVVHLHRRRFAGLSADDIPVGEYRALTPEEVLRLRARVGLGPAAEG